MSILSEAVQQVLDYKSVALCYRQVLFLPSVEELGRGGVVQQLKHIYCCYFACISKQNAALQSGGLLWSLAMTLLI